MKSTEDRLLFILTTLIISVLVLGTGTIAGFPHGEGGANVLDVVQGMIARWRDPPELCNCVSAPNYLNPYSLEPLDYINRIHIQFSDDQRFGIVCLKLRDPDNPEMPKLLTGDARGQTNNTVIRIDGGDHIYGEEGPELRWVRERGRFVKELPIPGKDKDRSWMSAWEVGSARVRVTQSGEIVVGEMTRIYDTVLVKYTVTNRDKVSHTVGLRVMLNTCIGSNGGAPFYVPPTDDKPERWVDKMEVISWKDMPDFIQAGEKGDFDDPDATIAVLGLKLRGFEPLDKLVICRWPGDPDIGWAWLYQAMNEPAELPRSSCVALYWAIRTMRPGEQRELAFTYGLGRIVNDVGCICRE